MRLFKGLQLSDEKLTSTLAIIKQGIKGDMEYFND